MQTVHFDEEVARVYMLFQYLAGGKSSGGKKKEKNAHLCRVLFWPVCSVQVGVKG